MYGEVINEFLYVFILYIECFNLLLSSIGSDSEFIVQFVVDLQYDQFFIFDQCGFIVCWLVCCIDIVLIQCYLYFEIDMWCDWVKYECDGFECFIQNCVILCFGYWCFCQFVY